MRYKNQEVKVNHDTGEVTTTSKSYSVKTKTEGFYIVFINAVSGLYNLKSATDSSILTYFCTIAQYNTGEVFLPAPTRKKLMTDLNISTQTLTNSIAKLKGLRLITGDQGLYIISPAIFWKGSFDEREKLMKNKKLMVNFSFEEEEEKENE